MKYPKSIGACADMLFDLRETRLAADRAAAKLKADETALQNHIIENLDKSSSGAMGKHHAVRVVIKEKPRVNSEKWNEFYAWVGKNKAWALLQKRLSEDAMREMLAAGKKIPGVEMFTHVSVSLTKIGEK